MCSGFPGRSASCSAPSLRRRTWWRRSPSRAGSGCRAGGGSGVLATVATGLYVSWNGPLLIPSATRLQGIFFWDLIIYLIEGFVFLLTGLQARTLFEQVERFALRDIAVATLLTTAIVIVARFAWVFPATYLPRWLSPSLRKRDPSPPWQQVFVLASIGVRGVVSLAAALAIPLTLANGARL